MPRPSDSDSADDSPDVDSAVDRESQYPPPPEQGIAPCPRKKTHWVEVRLVDSTHKSVPGVKCRLRASDDSIHNASLNAKGICRFDGLPEGDAFVCFPEYDEEAWSKV